MCDSADAMFDEMDRMVSKMAKGQDYSSGDISNDESDLSIDPGEPSFMGNEVQEEVEVSASPRRRGTRGKRSDWNCNDGEEPCAKYPHNLPECDGKEYKITVKSLKKTKKQVQAEKKAAIETERKRAMGVYSARFSTIPSSTSFPLQLSCDGHYAMIKFPTFIPLVLKQLQICADKKTKGGRVPHIISANFPGKVEKFELKHGLFCGSPNSTFPFGSQLQLHSSYPLSSLSVIADYRYSGDMNQKYIADFTTDEKVGANARLEQGGHLTLAEFQPPVDVELVGLQNVVLVTKEPAGDSISATIGPGSEASLPRTQDLDRRTYSLNFITLHNTPTTHQNHPSVFSINSSAPLESARFGLVYQVTPARHFDNVSLA